MSFDWDCVVVGGGAAGQSAALVLGRARRRALLLDAGGQSNLVAEGIGGLLGNDRRAPADFYAAGREEIAGYPSVEVRDVEARGGAPRDGGFVLELADGSVASAATVVLATGMDYRYPEIPGAAERWGRSVFHCPFCHGWEVRGKPLAVYGNGERGLHQAALLTSWSEEIALLTDGPADLPGDGAERLRAAGVEIDERPVAELRGEGSSLDAVAFAEGSERPLGGLLVAVTLERRSELPAALGAAAAEPTPLGSESVAAGPMMDAGAPGLFAAGDLLPGPPSVPAAIASGAQAGAGVVATLTGAA